MGNVTAVGRLVVDKLGIYIDRVPRSRVLGYLIALVIGGAVVAGVLHRTPLTESDRVARTIAEAEAVLAKAEDAPDAGNLRSMLLEARGKLAQAHTALSDGRLSDARGLALDGQAIAERVLRGIGIWDAIVLDTIGDVKVQQRDRWQDARAGMKLREGDWVKTGTSGSVEIVTSDGSRLSIGPGSLFEVHRTRGAQEPEPGSRLKVVDGTVRTQTGEQRSTVITDSGTARTDSHSESRVDVRNDKQVSVKVFGGTAQFSVPKASVDLGRGDLVKAADDGVLERQKLPDVPALRSPEDSAVFDLGANPRVTLAWSGAPGIRRYHVQIASSSFFTPETLLANLESHPKTSVNLRVSQDGAYFWRVAAVDAAGLESDWSAVRRVRMASAEALRAAGPPTLQLSPPQVLGERLVSISGKTDPGASVTVDGEGVTLQGDGRFQKIVTVGDNNAVVRVRARNSAGLTTERSVPVVVRIF